MSRGRVALTVLLPLAWAGVVAPDAPGQSVRSYRLADVGPLAGNAAQFAWLGVASGPPSAPLEESHENTLGLNDDGIVVGGFVSSVSPPRVHAFAWLPRAQHGLPAGLTDLHAAVWTTGTESSWGSDVNEAGVVAGQMGSDIAAACHAHVWTLASTIVAADLHTTSGGFSAATAINEETVARVAGQTTQQCPLEGSGLPFVFSGFHRTVSSADSMALLGSLGDSPLSLANGLRRTLPLRIVGGDLGELADPEDPCYVDALTPLPCSQPATDAIAWTVTTGGATSLELEGLGTTVPGVDDQGAIASDINEDGDVAGVGWDIFTGVLETCPAYATVWPGGVPGPHNLGKEFTPHLSSRALALTDRDGDGCVTVVGESLEGEDGLLWYGSGASWCAARLSDLVLDPACVEIGGRVVISVHDVNNHGVAAVVYRRPVAPPATGNEYRAGLITDAADLNGDLRINTLDRAMLMAAYCGGSLPACAGKPESDLNCDGVVNATDLAILSARWTGDSGTVTLRKICACGESESMAAAAPFDELAAATEAIADLGFELEQFSTWLKTAAEGDADTACQFVADTVTLKKGGA